MTKRIISAIENPLVDAIGHLSGRKIERRAPYALDADRVIEAAVRTGTMLEINASPDRRDLNEVNARAAAAGGRADPDQLRRASGRRLRGRPLRGRDRPAGVADRGRRRQHRPWAEVAALRPRNRSPMRRARLSGTGLPRTLSAPTRVGGLAPAS